MKNVIIFDFNRTIYDPDEQKLFEYAFEILGKLSTKFSLILLGKGGEFRRDIIKELNIEVFFQDILIVSEKTVEQLMEIKAKYPQGTTFYSIGDRIKKEILFGNQLQFKTVWFKNGKFADEKPNKVAEQPWKTINHLRDLEKIFVCSPCNKKTLK